MAVVTGLQTEYNAATSDATLMQKVEMAILNAAQAIANEGSAVTNHANRSTLAKAVTQPGASALWAPQFTKLIFALGTQDLATDAGIQNAVNAVWNTPAGGL